ncbi:hypothetical protein KMM349_20280 [Stenotrophomonas maltophilia]|nr:hypothetical protein KMM349_20280 [Stenotrophomonas maltophilia]
MVNRRQGEVAVGHVHVAMLLAGSFDELGGELAADRLLAKDAGINVQEFHAGSRSKERDGPGEGRAMGHGRTLFLRVSPH